MKKLSAVLFLSTLSSLSVAGEEEGQFGLGFQVSNNTTTISVPYRLNSDWRVEPFLGYSQSSSETDGKDLDGFEESSQYDSEQYNLGVSLARTLLTQEKLSLYSGVSLAYVQLDSDSSSSDGRFSETDFSRYEYQYDYNDKTELTGYETALSLGLQYQIFDNIELAGEVALNYRDLSGDVVNSRISKDITIDKNDASNNTTDVDVEQMKSDKDESVFYTSSKLIVRIYF